MNLLIFGTTGQVARELARRAPPDMRLTQLSRTQADLSDPAACAAAIFAGGADAVINAAAWTAVDQAEAEETAANTVNAAAPAAMAMACAPLGLPFLHLSTDYVFDGQGDTPFAPDHPTAPQNAYGRTKLRGEEAIRAAGGNHLILRTSWVFSAHGSNFLKTMLRLGATKPSLSVVSDQIGGPTPAAAIADALFTFARAMKAGRRPGIQHFSGTPDTSWATFARAIMSAANLPCRITDIPTAAYPTPAQRPLNSRLDCSGLPAYGLQRPDWRAAIPLVLQELA